MSLAGIGSYGVATRSGREVSCGGRGTVSNSSQAAGVAGTSTWLPATMSRSALREHSACQRFMRAIASTAVAPLREAISL